MGGSRKYRRFLFFLIAVVSGGAFLFLPFSAGGEVTSKQGFRAITGPCLFQFPRDHGAHPGYRTEWWYYTGNVEDAAGTEFGFQLTLFRTQTGPPGAR